MLKQVGFIISEITSFYCFHFFNFNEVAILKKFWFDSEMFLFLAALCNVQLTKNRITNPNVTLHKLE